MEVIKIKKQNISPNIKPFNDKPHLKNNRKIAYHKKNNIRRTSSKKILNKRLSLSFEEMKSLKKSENTINNSFENPLELDYLNFSKIDLFKLNQSFEDDIFTPNNIKNKKRIVEDRYEDTISTMNENSTINKNLEINMNIENLNASEKGNIMNTPSSLCNYYGQSTFKKTSGNNNYNDLNPKLFNDIKKDLSNFYNKNSEGKEDLNQKEEKNESIYKNNYNRKCQIK